MSDGNISAPIDGWNTVDDIATMKPTFAKILDNLIPGPASVYLRNGHTAACVGVGTGNVSAIFELKAALISKMIAAAGGAIYDVSSSTATLLKSGFSSNHWEGAIMNAEIGLVNGVDAPQTYDGSSVSNMTVSGSGLTVTDLSSITIFKKRSYFTEKNSQSFWYSALNTLGGALTEFPLGNVGNFGGNLIAIEAVTKDGGDGTDDNICFFMSTGEIIAYRGTSPGSDFVEIGVYRTGRPVSRRSIQKFGPDIFVVTNQGYITLSSLLPLSYGKTNVDLNEYIKGAAVAAVSSYGANFGWQVIISPTDGLLIVNVPQTSSTFVQHILNVNTKKWCRFTGLPAVCWCVFGNNLYFGSTNGTVYQYAGDNDNGEDITAIYETPYLSPRGDLFLITGFLPVLKSDSSISLLIKNSVDFKEFSVPYTKEFPLTGAMWGDPWGSAWAVPTLVLEYLSLGGIGSRVSLHLEITTRAELKYFGTKFLYKS